MNAEDVERLVRSVDEWNRWRGEEQRAASHESGVLQPEAAREVERRIDLSGAELHGRDLRNANLRRVNLHGATLTNANLREADLIGADLSGAKLGSADFGQADLSRTDLRNASMDAAKFVTTDLSNSTLTGASLRQAMLLRADLSDADLRDADLTGAKLIEADLVRSKLTGAMLDGADLTNSNLTGAVGLQLNRSLTRGAMFSPDAADLWSVLRRSYTGPRLLFHIILLLIFIAPYAGRTVMWLAVNRGQGVVVSATTQLNEIAEKLLREESRTAVIAGEAIKRIAAVKPCMALSCRELPVWKMLLGVDERGVQWVLTVVLLVYNLCRGLLTWLVAPLREEEDRSGYSPSFAGRGGYGWLGGPHRVVQTLFVVAVGSFAYHFYYWLTTPVYVRAAQ